MPPMAARIPLSTTVSKLMIEQDLPRTVIPAGHSPIFSLSANQALDLGIHTETFAGFGESLPASDHYLVGITAMGRPRVTMQIRAVVLLNGSRENHR